MKLQSTCSKRVTKPLSSNYSSTRVATGLCVCGSVLGAYPNFSHLCNIDKLRGAWVKTVSVLQHHIINHKYNIIANFAELSECDFVHEHSYSDQSMT